MIVYSVQLSIRAQEDISAIEEWIAGEADEDVAARYVDRIERYIAKLGSFPHRGSGRADIGHEVRSLAFERRYLILYTVKGSMVVILRIVSGAKNLADLSIGDGV